MRVNSTHRISLQNIIYVELFNWSLISCLKNTSRTYVSFSLRVLFHIHQWHRSGVFIVNFEYISHFTFLLLTLNMYLPVGYYTATGTIKLAGL